jgi:membrane protein YqaA with SNARE-associated domain
MRSALASLLASFISPWGLVVVAILDASLVFFLPFGVDFVLIITTARHPHHVWLWPLLATVGSVTGAALTFWIGRKAGEAGLTRLVKPSRLARVKARVHKGAPVVATLALIPPPFPFTPLVLTTGALDTNPWSFFGTLAAARLARFGAESLLASWYGTGILRWMETPSFEALVGAFIAVVLIGTILSAVALARETRGRPGSA